jgi:hypothetical protein
MRSLEPRDSLHFSTGGCDGRAHAISFASHAASDIARTSCKHLRSVRESRTVYTFSDAGEHRAGANSLLVPATGEHGRQRIKIA